MRMTVMQYLRTLLGIAGVAVVTAATMLIVILILRIDLFSALIDRLMSPF
jgi:hypothetical protein